MGLDASVMCLCMRDGKCRKPPFPLERIAVDEDGWLELTASAGETVTDDEYQAFDGWRYDACEHQDMDEVCERISNWYGVRHFQQTLKHLGQESFPVLLAAIPNANGGSVPAEKAPHAMQELDLIEKLLPQARVSVLIDEDTQKVVYHHIEAWQGQLIFHGRAKVRAGLDQRGFFVLDDTGSQADQTIFLASRFIQKPAPFCCDRDPGEHNVLLIDATRGETLRFPSPIETPVPSERRFRVEHRTLSPEEHAHTISALRTVFRASMKTGNPVRWF